uniref:Large ribosomal subunit protein uL11m n=1 Tax=Palpitomonas bilix TaxID=652834 RepID=A0A7S3LT42_9EUKA|mmetsp:Transcript_45181/g.116906  ORF Transcript_45181/g.116906 Transcript_45181/m.116906 type:complete len:144 (+) Transcript_45181:58-489(+)|eukprot:CAMPEP_0113883040 /NCGR_PEP_ID=MMETSP0780_2-20120614/9335_1 /TAXON_ID=652834 /ORGANISM="Palpitomonas bilix" /LENGTH=143 /DNA_ID=CAMNT_0000870213 /DNA_START=17 /DNA_END=448 /DNA_ORIENTATION=- /assembly_acc=CAM_ASM_000599
MAAREFAGRLKLLVPAGKASPSPPVGPALGQKGINIMEFCKAFNADTNQYLDNLKLPVTVIAYKDRSFEYSVKTPPSSFFLKQAAGIGKGARSPGKDVAGQLSVRAIYEIAKVKAADEPGCNLQSVCKTLMATAKSMGLQITR